MSDLSNVVHKVGAFVAGWGGLDLSGWKGVDENGNAVTLTGKPLNITESVEGREIAGSILYTDSAGVAHTLQYTTQQKETGDTISVDGVAMTDADVDVDLHWSSVVVQFRFTDAAGVAHQLQFTDTVGLIKTLAIWASDV